MLPVFDNKNKVAPSEPRDNPPPPTSASPLISPQISSLCLVNQHNQNPSTLESTRVSAPNAQPASSPLTSQQLSGKKNKKGSSKQILATLEDLTTKELRRLGRRSGKSPTTSKDKESNSESESSSDDDEKTIVTPNVRQNGQRSSEVATRRGSVDIRTMPDPEPIRDISGGKGAMHVQLFESPTISEMSEAQLYKEGKPGEGCTFALIGHKRHMEEGNKLTYLEIKKAIHPLLPKLILRSLLLD